MSQINKILVAGASIAGPAVCYWLKQFGFSPTLIEKHDGLRKGGYAIDLRGIATEVARRMGIYDRVCEMRTSLRSGKFVDAAGNVIHEEAGEKFGFRQGDEVEIVRGDLVEILMHLIPDVHCYFNRVITSMQQHDNHVAVTFNDGLTENFDVVIGADGLHSATRRMTFTSDEYQMLNLGSYISVFTIPNYLKLDHSEMLFETKEKLIYVSSDKNPAFGLAGCMFRSNEIPENIRDERVQKDFLIKNYLNLGWDSNKILALMENSDDFYFDTITQVRMPVWHKGRVVLLGDAGYCASPLSGQGTSLALVGAYLLAGELKKANGNYAEAFANYHTLLTPFVNANQAFGAWVSESFLSPEEMTSEMTAERSENILQKMQSITSAIMLPDY